MKLGSYERLTMVVIFPRSLNFECVRNLKFYKSQYFARYLFKVLELIKEMSFKVGNLNIIVIFFI